MSLPPDVHRLLPCFLAAADCHSFSAAARQLGLTPAAVSKSVRTLEQRLALTLFQRNTHFVTLTEEGVALRQRIGPLWQALNQALESPDATPAGWVRTSVIPGFGRYSLLPLLPEFQRRYPQVRIDLALEARKVNLIGERYDVAIGQRTAEDTRLVARPLRPIQHMLAASPDYLAQYGTPQHPQDLLQHRCLMHRNPGDGKLLDWLPGHPPLSEQQAYLITTLPDALVDAALSDMGVVCLSHWYLETHIARGDLVPLLQPWWPEPQPLWLWYPSADLPPRVRVWVEFVLSNFSP
ncbi:LysR family transcriptional regulator [Erwiniaceae bacterium BAC15a-03b]|uniref:LysR family transcriptional regulator n=1 Tax=Winslowiella arboricola TaxID=2978220 RepID=A0A9J6PEI8_9GAMM|nr:LysR family transcriptional regulator [Winslowiella arboricola]MCU5773381.1 LysR family transcriptional regulator [Winslowiella arboricola]MCU5776705.1 LysR family transcriptional regulator [Winslowiella arboricola]